MTTTVAVQGVDVRSALTQEADGAPATGPLSDLDKALKPVDTQYSDLVAIQNHFESTITSLNNTIPNLAAERSPTEDLQHAGTSLLT